MSSNLSIAPPQSQQPDEFWRGIQEFNRGEFYACHDTLEALWIEAMEPDKTFYQGILQIAVGIYHLSNLNWRGAAILMGEGLNRLNRYDGSYGGIDVDELIGDSAALLRSLQGAGEEKVSAVAKALALIPEDEIPGEARETDSPSANVTSSPEFSELSLPRITVLAKP